MLFARFAAPNGWQTLLLCQKRGKERMCVDFTNLNKACPQDPFPLPRIDQIIDSTVGCDLLSFLDTYSGYHQIFMSKEDEEKTSFITPCGTYFFCGCLSG